MQSSAFVLSSSIPLLKSRNPRLRASTFRFDPVCLSLSSKSTDHSSVNGGVSACKSSSLSSSLPSSRFYAWSSLPSPISDRRSGVVVRATSVIESAGESAESSSLMQTLQIGSLFGLWYVFNIYFDIYNKQVLKVFPYPVTITMVQFAVGSVLVLLMWGLNLYKKPKISGAQITT